MQLALKIEIDCADRGVKFLSMHTLPVLHADYQLLLIQAIIEC